MELLKTENFYRKNIVKRSGKIDHFKEAIYIQEIYERANKSDDPGSTISNLQLAEEVGISRRVLMMKKFIGKNICRKLYRVIQQYPKINHFKLLYSLAHYSHEKQEALLYKILHHIKTGVSVLAAMQATGIIKKEKNNMEVPAGKIAIVIDKHIAEKAQKYLNPEWSLNQHAEFHLGMEIAQKEREKMLRNTSTSFSSRR